MLLAARQTMLMSGAKLPYDAEVEYLESTGTQYVNSGVPVVNALVGTEIEFQATSTANNKWLFGMYNDRVGNADNYLIGSYSGWCVGLYDNAFYRPGISTDTANRHVVKINIDAKTMFDSVVLSNQSATKTDAGQFDLNAYLFASHRGYSRPSAYSLPARIYYCKIWVDGTLTRNLIPVRVGSGSSAVGYLYDRANPTGGPLGNGLYGNAADGHGGKAGFPSNLIGPDK